MSRVNAGRIFQRLLKILSAALVLAMLAQFFIAGMAAVTAPEWWDYHKAWVAVFQWLVVPLPILAWFSGPPRTARVVLAGVPVFQIALQYIFAHRALEGRLPIGLGLHALNAAVMLMIVAALALGWLSDES